VSPLLLKNYSTGLTAHRMESHNPSVYLATTSALVAQGEASVPVVAR